MIWYCKFQLKVEESITVNYISFSDQSLSNDYILKQHTIGIEII